MKIFVEDSGKQGTFKFRGKRIFTSNIVFKTVCSDDSNNVLRTTPRRRLIIPAPIDNADNDEVNRLTENLNDESDPDYDTDENCNKRNDTSIAEVMNVRTRTSSNENDDSEWNGAVPFVPIANWKHKFRYSIAGNFRSEEFET